jgi:hypothetical protein
MGNSPRARIIMKTLAKGVSTVQFGTFTKGFTFPPVGTKPAYVWNCQRSRRGYIEYPSSLTSIPSDPIALTIMLLPAGSLVIAGYTKRYFQATGNGLDVKTHSKQHLDYALATQ